MYKLAADSNENAKQPKLCENCAETCENSEKLTQSESKIIETKVDVHVQHDDKKPAVVENNDYLQIWLDNPVPDSPPPPLPPRTYRHKPLERSWAMPPTANISLEALRQLKPRGLMNCSNTSPVVESITHKPLTRASSRAGDHVNMKCSVQKTLSNDTREQSRFMMLTNENRKPRRTESKHDTALPPGKIYEFIFNY